MAGPPMRGRASYARKAAPVGRFGGDGSPHKNSGLSAYWKGMHYALSLIWAVRRGYVVLNLLFPLWNVPVRAFGVFIVQFVVDTAIGSGDFAAIVRMCAAYAALMLAYSACQAALENRYNVVAADVIRSGIQLRLHEQARDIDLAAFDTKEFYDDFARALDVLDERVIKCFKDLTSVLSSIISVVTLASAMVILSPSLIGIVVAGCLFAIGAYTKRSEVAVKRNLAITPLMRRFQYLNDLYYKRQFAKDMRVEHINDVAVSDHKATMRELEAADKHFGTQSATFTFIGSLASVGTDVSIYLFLAWGLVSGSLQAGGFMASWNAAVQFSNSMKSLFRAVPELGETCLLIADVIDFDKGGSTLLEPPDDEATRILPEGPTELEMRDISFSYVPGSKALNDVSFKVNRGQTLAIVGHNGAGKSTLAKLLLRLYDPDSGEVLLDGSSYKDYLKPELRDQVAVVFQDHCHYAYSIAENVLMRPPREGDDKRVMDALARVGLADKVQALDRGIDTHITREFSEEGELFSGGELQRLAIARALAKDAPIIVFDEASSALDPIAEREAIDMMEELFSDKICIVVSHRLSMTRDADCILVMDGGQIVERGTHDELLRKNGAYKRLWEAQAGKYV